MTLIILIFSFCAFTLSASAGLGGSLILVPALAMAVGPKEGIVLASVLLALNNVGKVAAYRRDIPLAAAALVVLATIVGAAIGSTIMAVSSEQLVGIAVFLAIGLTFVLERLDFERVRRAMSAPLAFLAGGTSGFSGTSGPLKGVAIRSLGLPREQFVGAASLVSLAGDSTKLAVFAATDLVDSSSAPIVLAALPLMVIGVLLGKRLNRTIGECGYFYLFWIVMTGYTVRLVSFVV